jgi:hypothetical protein
MNNVRLIYLRSDWTYLMFWGRHFHSHWKSITWQINPPNIQMNDHNLPKWHHECFWVTSEVMKSKRSAMYIDKNTVILWDWYNMLQCTYMWPTKEIPFSYTEQKSTAQQTCMLHSVTLKNPNLHSPSSSCTLKPNTRFMKHPDSPVPTSHRNQHKENIGATQRVVPTQGFLQQVPSLVFHQQTTYRRSAIMVSKEQSWMSRSRVSTRNIV